MNPSVNPLSFASYKIGTETEQKKFLKDLSQLLSQMLNQISTTQNAITASPQTSALGTITGTATTFNAQSAFTVALSFSFSTAVTLTINNLPTGAIVLLSFTNTAAGARVLKLNANTPSGTSYTSILANAYNVQQNLLTGWSIATNTSVIAVGITMTGPALNFVAQ